MKKKTTAICLATCLFVVMLAFFGCGPGNNGNQQAQPSQNQGQQNQGQNQNQGQQQQTPPQTNPTPAPTPTPTPAPSPTPSPNPAISADQAKAIAFQTAGVAEASVWGLTVEQGSENGVYVWEIDFKYNGYDYEYDIDANTGAVVKNRVEVDD